MMDTKSLTDILSQKLDISRETVVNLIDNLTSVLGDCASELDSVSIPSFGCFEPKKRLERVAVHPASGAKLLVPPKIVLSFRPSPLLKQKIRRNNGV